MGPKRAGDQLHKRFLEAAGRKNVPGSNSFAHDLPRSGLVVLQKTSVTGERRERFSRSPRFYSSPVGQVKETDSAQAGPGDLSSITPGSGSMTGWHRRLEALLSQKPSSRAPSFRRRHRRGRVVPQHRSNRTFPTGAAPSACAIDMTDLKAGKRGGRLKLRKRNPPAARGDASRRGVTQGICVRRQARCDPSPALDGAASSNRWIPPRSWARVRHGPFGRGLHPRQRAETRALTVRGAPRRGAGSREAGPGFLPRSTASYLSRRTRDRHDGRGARRSRDDADGARPRASS